MRNALILVACMALVLAVTFALQDVPPPVRSVPAIDATDYAQAPLLPTFTLPDLAGDERNPTREGQGKTQLVHFWATWCAPCVREIPSLIALAQDSGPDALQIWAVSVDRDAKTVTEFLDRNDFVLPDHVTVLMDVRKTVSQDVFQTYRYPETVVVDPQGRMIRKIAGDQDWTDPAIQKQIGLRP